PTPTTHERLRGEGDPGDVVGWLHPAARVLHRTVATDRASFARAHLRRPARMLPRRHAGRNLATRAAGVGKQRRPRYRLSACDPRAAPQADGFAQSRLSRSIVPSSRLRASVRSIARTMW